MYGISIELGTTVLGGLGEGSFAAIRDGRKTGSAGQCGDVEAGGSHD
jgi:hypothetical protein